MRTRFGLALIVALVAPGGARAGTPDCPALHAAAERGLPAGQDAATVTGPSPQVEPPTRHVAVPEGALDTVRIALARTECLGICPSYAVVVRGDGSAAYDGDAYVLVAGHHDFAVPKPVVRCLLEQFRRADFWSLADRYVAEITDGAQYTLTLSIGGQSKSVIDYFGLAVRMPESVTALEDEVDRIAADRWVVGTADTLPNLRDEHFDFHSPAAAIILANGAAKAPEAMILAMLDAGTPATGQRSPAPMLRPGTTAVEIASRAGRTAIVEALIARGALANAPPGVKEGALRGAAASGDPHLVADILNTKPAVDAVDYQGDTALIELWNAKRFMSDQARVDLPAVARLLLAAGADPNIANHSGDTALFGASDAATVKLLIAAGARIDVRNTYGSTPLLYAATDDAAVALIEAGADVTATDRFGDTIEKKAESRKFAATLQLLHNGASEGGSGK